LLNDRSNSMWVRRRMYAIWGKLGIGVFGIGTIWR
jgi:hypothetical protein